MLSATGRGVLVVRTWHDPDLEAVVLEINDDGPGIPDVDLARKPGYSTATEHVREMGFGEAALVTRVLPFALIGVFCALCAIALGGVVHLVLSATRSTP